MRRLLLIASLIWLTACCELAQAQNGNHFPGAAQPGTRSPATSANDNSIWQRDQVYTLQDGQNLSDGRPNYINAAHSSATGTISDSGIVQELGDTLQDQNPSSQQVPNAPATSDAQRQVGPGLQVQSNAATLPDEAYERGSWCQLGEPFHLFGCTPRGTMIGGWWQSGYHSDDDGLFNSHDDRPRLHQAWLYAENKADRCCTWDVGYRVDLMYGVDGIDLQAFGNPPAGAPTGWDNSWDHGIYGWALPQAYLEFARDNRSIVVGKFFSPMGYESLMSPQNFFYSHSFARYFLQPFSMSGVLSRFDFSPDLRLLSGVTAGWDTGFEQANSGLTYVGGFEYTPCEPINVRYYGSAGDTGYLGDGWTSSLSFDLMLTQKLNYIVEANAQNLDATDQYGLVNYLLYRVNPCLAVGSRFEWFVSDRFTGRENATYSWNGGINFRKNANITLRPEVRVDWGAGAVDPGQVILASDFILTF